MDREVVVFAIQVVVVLACSIIMGFVVGNIYIKGYKQGFANALNADPATIELARKFAKELEKETKNAN